MPRIRLDLVLADLIQRMNEARELVAMASQLPTIPNQHVNPPFRVKHTEQIISLAFLSGFLAWEKFVEESFILYTLGKRSPKGYSPHLFISPRNREHAIKFAKGDRRFPLWNDYDFIIDRSRHFFKDGRPYIPTYRLIRNHLLEMKTVRNAIAHSSNESQEKFKTLVRDKLRHYPRGLSPGGFLVSLIPKTNPPNSFFSSYFDTLVWAAERIVPN